MHLSFPSVILSMWLYFLERELAMVNIRRRNGGLHVAGRELGQGEGGMELWVRVQRGCSEYQPGERV